MNPKFNEVAFARLKSNYKKSAPIEKEKRPKKKEKVRPQLVMEKESFISGIDTGGKLMRSLFDGIIGAVLMFILSSELVCKTLGMFIGGFYEEKGGLIIPQHIRYYYQHMPVGERKVSMKGKLILAAIFIGLFALFKNWFITEY